MVGRGTVKVFLALDFIKCFSSIIEFSLPSMPNSVLNIACSNCELKNSIYPAAITQITCKTFQNGEFYLHSGQTQQHWLS